MEQGFSPASPDNTNFLRLATPDNKLWVGMKIPIGGDNGAAKAAPFEFCSKIVTSVPFFLCLIVFGLEMKKEGATMPDNKIELKVVVNTVEVTVEANLHAPLQTIVEPALKKSGNTGQSPKDWLIKDAAGNELNGNQKIEDFHFTDESVVYLSLKAGIGGC